MLAASLFRGTIPAASSAHRRAARRARPIPLAVEELEPRRLLANAAILSGVLTISSQTGALVVTAVANNRFQITDNGNPVGGTWSASNIAINGTLNNPITVDLAGFTLSGTLNVTAANGGETIALTDSVGGGLFGGNIKILGGLGSDTVDLNSTGTHALTFGYIVNVTDNNPGGTDTLNTGNAGGVTKINGPFGVTGFNFVNLVHGSNDTFGSDVSLAAGAKTSLNVAEGLIGGSEVATVAGSLTLVGGTLDDTAFLRGLVIAGNLTAKFGNTGAIPNYFVISSSAASVTTVNGNLEYDGGIGVDIVDLRAGIIHGNATVNLSEGNDQLYLASFAGQITQINGNLNINAGNGNVTFDNITAIIGGNVNIKLGNGSSSVLFDNGSSIGGALNWTSGSGGDSLTLAGAQTYHLNVAFGSGNDNFTVNNPAAVLLGLVDGGNGTNTFNLTAGAIGNTFSLLRFPDSITLANGVLTITGQTGALVLTAIANNQFLIQDGALSFGVWQASSALNITDTLASPITIDLAGHNFNGSITINASNTGGETVTLTDSVGGGSVGGNVLISGIAGDHTVNLNSTDSNALTFNGTVTVLNYSSAGIDTLNTGNAGGVTTILGKLTSMGFNALNLVHGSNDFFGADVYLAASGKSSLNFSEGNPGGSEVATIVGNLTIVGGLFSDSAFLSGLVITGNLVASFGNVGPNLFILSVSPASVTTIDGNLQYNGGNGVDIVDPRGGVILGNATFNLFDGNDFIFLGVFGPLITQIGGNLTINAGNGNVTFENITAIVGGNVNINLGNGSSSVVFDVGSFIGGTLNWSSGNGGDSLTLAGTQAYLLNVVFGSGNDNLILDNPAAILFGQANGGSGVNTFTLLAGTLGAGFQLVNFP